MLFRGRMPVFHYLTPNEAADVPVPTVLSASGFAIMNQSPQPLSKSSPN